MAMQSYHKEKHSPDKAPTPFHGKEDGKTYDQQCILWDPVAFDPFEAMGTMLNGPLSLFQNVCAASTRVDWKETSDHHIFKADLPGLKKEDVRVSVEDGHTLQILGHRAQDDLDNSATWHRVERNQNKFLRRFRLPENARVDGMKTKVEHGVLTITVPKEKTFKAAPKSSIDIPVHWE